MLQPLKHGLFLIHLKKAYTYLIENRDTLSEDNLGFNQDFFASCISGFAFKSYLNLPWDVQQAIFYAALKPYNYYYSSLLTPDKVTTFKAIGYVGIQHFLRTSDSRLYDLYWTEDEDEGLSLTRKILEAYDGKQSS